MGKEEVGNNLISAQTAIFQHALQSHTAAKHVRTMDNKDELATRYY